MLLFVVVATICAQNQIFGTTDCVDTTATNLLANGDFENDAVAALADIRNFTYMVPDRWVGIRTAVIHNLYNIWGKSDSQSGEIFCALQGKGARVEQLLKGLDPAKVYIVNFLTAERKGAGIQELLTIRVNSQVIYSELNPTEDFQEYHAIFRPDSSGNAVIEFINDSEPGDRTVFLDNIRVRPMLDCGTGATCHERPAHQSGYICKCDEVGFLGSDVTNGKASCSKENPLDLVNTTITRLSEMVGKLLQDTADLKSRVHTLEEEGDGLRENILALTAENAAIKQSFATVQVNMESIVTEALGSAAGSETSIENKDKSVSINAERGLKLNEDFVLTEKQVRALIRDAVTDVLKNVVTEFYGG